MVIGHMQDDQGNPEAMGRTIGEHAIQGYANGGAIQICY